MTKPKVYLAGGFYGGWQDKIKEKLYENFIFLDPLNKEFDFTKGEHKKLTYEEYTAWDLWAIRESNIVFVYSQKTNPGQGYIVEAGYAKGLGKMVVLVRELGNEYMPDKYLKFIDCIADFVCNNFDEGIEFLSRLIYPLELNTYSIDQRDVTTIMELTNKKYTKGSIITCLRSSNGDLKKTLRRLITGN